MEAHADTDKHRCTAYASRRNAWLAAETAATPSATSGVNHAYHCLALTRMCGRTCARKCKPVKHQTMAYQKHMGSRDHPWSARNQPGNREKIGRIFPHGFNIKKSVNLIILGPGRAAAHFGFPGKVEIGTTLHGVFATGLKPTKNPPGNRPKIGRIFPHGFNIKKRVNLIILVPGQADHFLGLSKRIKFTPALADTTTQAGWPGKLPQPTNIESLLTTLLPAG